MLSDAKLLLLAALFLAMAEPSMADSNPATIAIAPLDEALTFARTGDGARLIAVTSYTNGRVTGTDITNLLNNPQEDAIDLVNRHDYAALRTAIEAAETPIEVGSEALGMPVRLGSEHIAVGTNYREHAEESTVEGGPFLFAKYVAPTSARASVPADEALLDFEVELCLVALAPMREGAALAGGLMLCNDFTDRATLLRNVDAADPQSGNGFTSGKSAPGYLPVGDLFVVPRDLNAFIDGLTLQLSVNGKERQRARATEWIWDFDEILRQARARRDVTWAYWGGTARLPIDAAGTIPERTLILAGTPAGTVFNGLVWSDYALGAFDWIIDLGQQSIVHQVIERYIARRQAQRIYLQPDDVVSIEVDRLGTLANTIRGPS